MYITDHQLNLESGNRFGETRATVPLVATPHIHCGNALRMDWNSVVKAEECDYVFGNPPFIGKQLQTNQQKEDIELVSNNIKNSALLDYVAGWYVKAVDYIKGTKVLVAFVSTNSITQGEQVSVLWSWMLNKGIIINFAHRTFRWDNEGKAVAAVHCVIVGFSFVDNKDKIIYSYTDNTNDTIKLTQATQINPYLVDAPLIVLEARRTPICRVPNIAFGNMANDGGFLFLDKVEKDNIISSYPKASKFIKKFLGAEEFINNINRWCIWLVDVSAEEIRAIPPIYSRVQQVKQNRLDSKRVATNNLASTPYLFGEIRQTNSPYILIPRHSSETRNYIPIGFLDSDVICGDANCMVPNASLSDFAVLTSQMHMAWVRIICGRIKSDFRYSNTIVYNNFVWDVNRTEECQIALTTSSQTILDARNLHPNASLADLYDPLTMPVELVKAHQANNKAVDEAYGYKGGDDDASRVAFLFKRYEELTSLLPATVVKKKRVKKTDDGALLI
jgi:hypothetical protein